MALQSISKTRVPIDYGTQKEGWPGLCLNTASCVQNMSGDKGEIDVALVDSGVPKNHPGGPFGHDRDDDGHATHLAATICGPAYTIPGVQINIRPFKSFSAQRWPEPEPGAKAIKRVKDKETFPGVVVLAWDVGHGKDELRAVIWDVGHRKDALQEAILAARDHAVVVIAAGNWSLDNDKHLNLPAHYGWMDHVLTVMATDRDNERASYSSYGQYSVYVAAPGFATIPAEPSSTLRTVGSLRDSYRGFRGTSAATAHVARLAALVRIKHPEWTPQEVKAHIGATAKRLDALKTRCVVGGIVDFEAALK